MKVGAWAGVFVAATFLGACGDSATFDAGNDGVIGAIDGPLTKGTAGARLGDADYCDSAANQCALGEGDCDSTSQCQTGLICVPGNLAKRGSASGDACAPSHCGNGLKDVDETSIDCGGTCGTDCAISCDKPNGHPGHCSTDCPCGAGEGDCDSVAECQPGLVCGTSNGAAFGLSAAVDVCWAPTCQNGTKDGNETAIDCGGSCSPCSPPPAAPVLVAQNGVPLLPITIAPHSDQDLHLRIAGIAADLRDKLNAIVGGNAAFVIDQPTQTPSGISLGIDGDFTGVGWPYQGVFRPADTLVGGVLRPERLTLQEEYILHTPEGANRVIVAGATADGLQAAVWDLLKRLGYRHYFQTPTWEVIPQHASLTVPALAVREKPAFASRILTMPGNAWETAFASASNTQFDDWLKHNRMGGPSNLSDLSLYGKVIAYWQARHGSAFPPELTNDPTKGVNSRTFCLTGSANVGGTQWTALSVVREWALAQTSATIGLSPLPDAGWASATTASGLHCNDANDAIFGNIANRIAALLNAVAEAQPTKLVTARLDYEFAAAPTLAVRQNVLVNLRARYSTQNPFVLEHRLRDWTSLTFEGGVDDHLGTSSDETPGQHGGPDHYQYIVELSPNSLVNRITRLYGAGARRYSASINWGWGMSGPTWWAAAQALWDADAPLTGEAYRADFLNNAFGAAAPAMAKFYAQLEGRPLWSENLIGHLYRSLQEGLTLENKPAVQERLADLAAYTRYLEFNRKLWNRCSTTGAATEQAELKDLLRFAYATRERRILESRDAMAETAGGIAACPSGGTCTAEGCVVHGVQTGTACMMPAWGVNCPSATPTTACGTCYGSSSCNEMKQQEPPTSAELRGLVGGGVQRTPILPDGVTRTFSRDLVPYTPPNPSLQAKMATFYTKLPYYLYLQRPTSSGSLGIHVKKFEPTQIISGQLSVISAPFQPIGLRLLGGTTIEADWTFENLSSATYRIDLDDQGGRMYATFPPGTRVALPAGADDVPLPLNYRYAVYFMVPAGTTNVVGWSQSDGAFRRYKAGPNNTFETINGYLSDHAAGAACPRIPGVLGAKGYEALNDYFVIPLTPPPATDEIWLFNDGNGGTLGERVLLSVPPYFYRDPAEMLVPREVSPEGVNPQPCSATSCPSGQYCSQQGFCRTDAGGCTSNNQCATGEACQNGHCACASNVDCSPTCRCGSGGSCTNAADCAAGYSCQAGTCQSCSNTSCTGEPCTTGSDCAPGLICAGGECRESCATHPNAPNCVESTCGNGIQDGAETDVDCGGGCEPCTTGEVCTASTDCQTGLACGINNGGYFDNARSTRVCWPVACEDGVEASECGDVNALCGPNCGGVKPCDLAQPSCPQGESCKSGLGGLFGVAAPAVCVAPSCPSNDPQQCGTWSSLCGVQCICTPDCSQATAASPKDGCGGDCPGVCGLGQACCSLDVHCPVGAACIAQENGPGVCRPRDCAYRHLEPPLCGQPGALCGETCPICTPACGGRQCGADPECGTSCGTCPSGNSCSATGQCVPESNDPPITVLSGTGGSVPIPPLPAGTTTPVGALAGTFGVSEQGTAQYNVPIDVPLGRAGMQPALSLAYAGPRVEGAAGAGWKIEGLSQITRCPRVYALDGYPAPIKNDTSDRFCLDGKRLEAVAGSAAYGGNGAEYRTLIDTFSKVTSHSSAALDDNGPEWFEVRTKDGRILTYGKVREALVLTGTGARNTWLLHRVEDRSGNNMIVRYRNQRIEMPAQLPALAASVVLPSAIHYTGNGSLEGDREVRFVYESRIDAVPRFVQGGAPLVAQYRLQRVITYVQGKAVKNYHLDYRSPAVSQVTKIYECVGATSDICKPPTEFEYVEQEGFEAPTTQGMVGSGAQLDVNGDGIPDYLSTTVLVDGVPANPTATAAFVTADVTIGIGAMFMTPAVGAGVNVVWGIGKMILFDALENAPNVTYSTNITIGSAQRGGAVDVEASGLPCPTSPSFFLDYDRDGKDDFAGACTRSELRFARSAGDGAFTNPATHVLPFVPRTSPTPSVTLYDVNGDALEDIVFCTDTSTLHVRLRRPSLQGFEPDLVFPGREAFHPSRGGTYRERIPYCSDALPIHALTDVDGDGTPDLMALYTPSQDDKLVFDTLSVGGPYRKQGMYTLRLRTASSGSRELFWEPIDVPNIGTYGWGSAAKTGDFNGDGLIDVANSYGEELKLWLNTGKGFQLQRVPHPRPALDRDPNARGGALSTFDYDGDGQADLLERWTTVDGEVLNAVVQPFAAPAPHGRLLEEISYQVGSRRIHPRIQTVRDLDGDGNVDLETSYGRFYGKALKNGLLSKVTDGLGNFVHVDYFDTYQATCETQSGSQWPEQCVKNLKGLVSGYRTGFNARYTDGTGAFITERTYSYKYENARISMTGHGWLGFDKVTVKEESGPGNSIFKTTTTEFWPVKRHTPAGQTTSSVDWPYLYPLAGLPRTITIDEGATGIHSASLEDVPHQRRTRRNHHWVTLASEAGRPFPSLEKVLTETSSCAMTSGAAPTDQECETRTLCGEINYTFDGYGNVKSNEKFCIVPTSDSSASKVIGGAGQALSIIGPGDGLPVLSQDLLESVMTTVDTFTHDAGQWLIAHPKHVRIAAYRYPATEAEVQDYVSDYDGLGRPTLTVRDPSGKHEQSITVYDELGNVEQITRTAPGEDDRTSFVGYGADRVLPTSFENAEGHVTQVRFSRSFGQIETLVDPNGVVVQNVHDGFGRRTLTIGPSGSTTFDVSNAPTTYIQTGAGAIHPRLQVSTEQRGSANSLGGRSERLLDSHGRVVRSVTVGLHGAKILSETIFDARGRVAATTAPHTTATTTPPTTTYEYDYLDRPTRILSPDGAVSERRYASSVHLGASHPDWLNELTCPLNAARFCGVDVELATEPHLPGEQIRESVALRDFSGQVVRTFDGENVNTAAKFNDFEYQPFGRLTRLLDNAKTPTILRHDPYGNLTTHVDPDSGARTYTYTPFGQLETSLDAKSQRRNYRYDRLGRLIEIVEGLIADPEHTTTWWYDRDPNGIGQLSESISPATPGSAGGQHVLYNYYPPSAGQHCGQLEALTHRIDGTDYQFRLHYDDVGRTKRIDYPDLDTGASITAEYGYDELSGMLTSVAEVGGNATRPLWSLTDAFQGLLPSTVQFGNGASSSLTYHPQRYTLDAIQTQLAGNTIQNLGYRRLANGQIDEHSRTRNGQARRFAYQYDPLGRLKVTTETFPGQTDVVQDYGYDDRGNLTTLAGMAIGFTNAAHPHLPNTVGSSTYGYDENGNLANRNGFEVPGWNQLLTYTPFDLPSSITTGDQVTTLDYNADEQRVARRELNRHRHFAGDLYERTLSPSGTTEQERFRIGAGGGIVAEIVRSPAAERILYVHPDALGTPETITDDEGAVDHQTYSPFGARVEGSTTLTRLGFTGHHQDDDIGFIDMGGRVYDPMAGRFTTADPILQAPFSSQGQNRYAYVFNDPINKTDPSGLAWDDTGSTGGNVAWGVGAAAWGGAAIYSAGSASGLSLSGVFTGGSSASALGGGAGLGLNVATTLLGSPFGGSPSARYSAPAPSTVANSSPVKPGGSHAVGQSAPSKALVQERPPGTSLFNPALGALAQSAPAVPGVAPMPLPWTPQQQTAWEGVVDAAGDAAQWFFHDAPWKVINGVRDLYRSLAHVPPPKSLDAFPDATRVKPKTPVQGGQGLRARWKTPNGEILEWDSQHGTVERYNNRGKHIGEFDPKTGLRLKPANPQYKVDP